MVMIGTGKLENEIARMIKENHLEEEIQLTGSMPPDKVRIYMEQADIFLATSDYQEGWGAVVNEAMNSGCAVIASHAMGSVPYLIKHTKNGVIYQSNNIQQEVSYMKDLLNCPKKRINLGKNAYHTMINIWNPVIAAKRFVHLTETILKSDGYGLNLFDYGPCSQAEVITQKEMYHFLVQEEKND